MSHEMMSPRILSRQQEVGKKSPVRGADVLDVSAGSGVMQHMAAIYS